VAEDGGWTVPNSWYGLTTRQRDFGNTVVQMAAMYSSPVILTTPNDRSVYHNASGFLFKPAERTFLVTNAHVIDDGYDPLREAHPDMVMVFANRVVEPTLVSKNSDKDVDLAVIDVGDIEFDKEAPGYWGSTAAKLTTYVPPSWPLGSPKEGESSVIVGWPAKFRTHETGGTEFAAFPMLGQAITSVGDKWFALPIDRDQLISSDFDPNNEAATTEKSFGGMSGTPVFALHRLGISPLQLVGVVRDYGCGLDVLYCNTGGPHKGRRNHRTIGTCICRTRPTPVSRLSPLPGVLRRGLGCAHCFAPVLNTRRTFVVPPLERLPLRQTFRDLTGFFWFFGAMWVAALAMQYPERCERVCNAILFRD
jgi:hypothetical protein